MQFKEVITVPVQPERTSTRIPKKHKAESERQYLVSLWRQSKLSSQKFCDEHGINPKTFSNWKRKYSSVSTSTVTNTANIKQHSASLSCNAIKLILPNGIHLSLAIDPQESNAIVSMIKEISQWNFN